MRHTERWVTVPIILWENVNIKCNVAMDSVSYAVGYNLSHMFFYLAWICLHFGKLVPFQVCCSRYEQFMFAVDPWTRRQLSLEMQKTWRFSGKFWSYTEEHFFLWFLSRLSQIIIISKKGCTECNIIKYECHDCVFKLDCVTTALSFQWQWVTGKLCHGTLCLPKILIFKINVVVVSYYVCRTLAFIFFLHCRYVVQLVTWELRERLWGLMGKVDHAPLVL